MRQREAVTQRAATPPNAYLHPTALLPKITQAKTSCRRRSRYRDPIILGYSTIIGTHRCRRHQLTCAYIIVNIFIRVSVNIARNLRIPAKFIFRTSPLHRTASTSHRPPNNKCIDRICNNINT